MDLNNEMGGCAKRMMFVNLVNRKFNNDQDSFIEKFFFDTEYAYLRYFLLEGY